MKEEIAFATKEEADEFVEALANLYGLPTLGVHVGGGKHVPLELCMTVAVVEVEEKGGEFVVPLVDEVKSVEGQKADLGGKEFTIDLTAKRQAAAEDEVIP